MTVNTDPIFTITPVVGVASISTANLARDGSGTLGTVISGSTNGTRITRVRVISSGSQVSNGMIRLFINTSGSNVLYDEVAVIATSVSASMVGFDNSLEYLGERAIILPNGASLSAGTTIAEPFNVWAEGGNY
jgi:hypothetical protein